MADRSRGEVTGEAVARTALALLRGVAAPVCGVLLAIAALTTFTIHISEESYSTRWLPLLSLVVALLAFGLSLRRRGALEAMDGRKALPCVAAALMAVGVVYTLFVATLYPGADQGTLTQAAQHVIRGTLFSPGQEWLVYYLKKYPFQWGYVFFLEAMFRLFGLEGWQAVRLLNSAMAVGGLCALAGLSRQMWPGRLKGNLAVCATALAWPFVLHANFVYGNVPSESLWMVGLWLQAAVLRRRVEGRAWDAGLAARAALCLACDFLATWMKPNALLAVAATAIVWALASLEREDRAMAGLAALTLVAYLAGSNVPLAAARSRYGVATDQAMPAAAYLAMGTQEGARNAGWWNAYNDQVYDAHPDDVPAAKAEAYAKLGEALGNFAAKPLYALDFLGRKVASQWSEPTYQSLWLGLYDGREVSSAYGDGTLSLENVTRELYWLACDAVQLLLYAASFAWMRWGRERLDPLRAGPAVTFLFGFGFHLIWEAKSLYVLPYALMLVPYAVAGLPVLWERADSLVAWGRAG